MVRTQYAHLDPPAGPSAHAVQHGETLYVSGLTAFGSVSQNGSMTEQAEAVMERLLGVIEAEGLSIEHLLKVTVFVTDIGSLNDVHHVLSRHYGQMPPASSLLHVAGLFDPELKIEIEAVIARPVPRFAAW